VGSCVPEGAPLGNGYSIPPEMEHDYDYGYEEGVGNNEIFPRECCEGDDCCPAGEIWP